MPMVPTGLVHQTQLANEIARAVRKLGKDAVGVNYSLGTDSTGDASIFFRIVLTDVAIWPRLRTQHDEGRFQTHSK